MSCLNCIISSGVFSFPLIQRELRKEKKKDMYPLKTFCNPGDCIVNWFCGLTLVDHIQLPPFLRSYYVFFIFLVIFFFGLLLL